MQFVSDVRLEGSANVTFLIPEQNMFPMNGSVNLVVAQAGTGKTNLAAKLAELVLLGGPAFGGTAVGAAHADPEATVIYYNSESGADSILLDACQRNGLGGANILMFPSPDQLAAAQDDRRLTPDMKAALVALLDRLGDKCKAL